MEMSLFNVHGGFPEGILRGLRLGFLTPDDYRKLASCETLEDVRTALDCTGEHDQIAGYIYIGGKATNDSDRPRPDPEAVISRWPS